MLFAGVANGASSVDSDLVNERFTTRSHDMETQWRVDCTATLGALRTTNRPLSALQRSALASDLRKCSFIYQPPGTGRDAHCPDYTQLWRALEAGDDPALASALKQAAACPGPGPQQ
ncbi:hypothetical protein [uncultured Haliea sp.]